MNININISATPEMLGQRAATMIAQYIRQAIEEKGCARIILSTGASQFETIAALVKEDLEWTKVEMFHLDEYVGLSESHIASFRKYLKERFVNEIAKNPRGPLKAAHFVNGEGDVQKNIALLTQELRSDMIDVGVIGIGENGHIAFNDPPADFTTDVAYKVVNLDKRCRLQQVGEGWFKGIDDVPTQAITMCPNQIMSCKHIVTCVPHAVKAEAIFNTITQAVTPEIPATLLKTHPDWNLFVDNASAAKLLGN
ncbi:MAG: 6-phosphogluconolactonase [Sphaerochaetaceae bacterium]|jgi:glucosamine-6-phosphate deaminase|nr:6-phosphogluconolactonase [Sphaerochaetaceae bacterium]NLO60696.1 glucosamine-6-phosphate deaminase [Spirochaetales bacterium]MDD2405396.1 6-phosphogluconolactonase [Sphaerochaetaceae bacterium]MDD3670105.1 6-phosphogluconolactonase [Sphaerochaetaceae bacterium]MDD4260539.1 6-phosphogluconolactonase [Sphaerochaetaceae bacterium]